MSHASAVKRAIAPSALSVLSRVNRRRGMAAFRAAVEQPGLVKINIGAAKHRIPGWINTDIHWRAQAYLDLLEPWPCQADRIYADNVIEHFTIADGRTVLRHAYEALKPGGGIRLATPDVERTARAYLDGGTLASEHLERHRKAGYTVHYPVDLLRVVFAESGHHLGYCHDFESLSSELRLAGFEQVARCESGTSSDEHFADLESRTAPTEAATMLVVEAWKP